MLEDMASHFANDCVNNGGLHCFWNPKRTPLRCIYQRFLLECHHDDLIQCVHAVLIVECIFLQIEVAHYFDCEFSMMISDRCFLYSTKTIARRICYLSSQSAHCIIAVDVSQTIGDCQQMTGTFVTGQFVGHQVMLRSHDVTIGTMNNIIRIWRDLQSVWMLTEYATGKH